MVRNRKTRFLSRYDLKIQLNKDKLYLSTWFVLLVLGMLGVFVAFAFDMESTNSWLLTVLSVGLVSLALIFSTEKQFVIIRGQELMMVKTLMSYTRIRSYHFSKISELRYRKHVKSDVYTSSGEVEIMGIDATPESMKDYYYHPELIEFVYGNKKIVIGKFKKAFGAQKIVSHINGKTI